MQMQKNSVTTHATASCVFGVVGPLNQLGICGGGGGGRGGGGLWRRGPQSSQSVPKLQKLYTLPGPPSSQPPSYENARVCALSHRAAQLEEEQNKWEHRVAG